MIIFGIVHIFSNVITSPAAPTLPPPWLPFEEQSFGQFGVEQGVNFSSERVTFISKSRRMGSYCSAFNNPGQLLGKHVMSQLTPTEGSELK